MLQLTEFKLFDNNIKRNIKSTKDRCKGKKVKVRNNSPTMKGTSTQLTSKVNSRASSKSRNLKLAAYVSRPHARPASNPKNFKATTKMAGTG